jgi:serine/threonine protein phosphatase PrpC
LIAIGILQEMVLINRFKSVGATDIGRRQNNEDTFLIDHDLGLFLVADGVGGHMAGEIASATAVASIRELILERVKNLATANKSIVADAPSLSKNTHSIKLKLERDRELVRASLDYASNAIFVEGQRLLTAEGRSMSTTIVGMFLQDGNDGDATIFNVGDSRLYVFRDRKLIQVSTDHSAFQEWLSQGRPGPEPSRNIILQALGQSPSVDPSVQSERLVSGDLILMCTDGLTDYLDDEIITEHLECLDRNEPNMGCVNLINAAIAAGGADNITVLLGEFT